MRTILLSIALLDMLSVVALLGIAMNACFRVLRSRLANRGPVPPNQP